MSPFSSSAPRLWWSFGLGGSPIPACRSRRRRGPGAASSVLPAAAADAVEPLGEPAFPLEGRRLRAELPIEQVGAEVQQGQGRIGDEVRGARHGRTRTLTAKHGRILRRVSRVHVGP